VPSFIILGDPVNKKPVLLAQAFYLPIFSIAGLEAGIQPTEKSR